jgi:hypothetical protein
MEVHMTFEKFIIGTAFSLAISLLLAWATQFITNWLFSPQLLLFVFGVSKISFAQGFVLNILGFWRVSSSSSDKKA